MYQRSRFRMCTFHQQTPLLPVSRDHLNWHPWRRKHHVSESFRLFLFTDQFNGSQLYNVPGEKWLWFDVSWPELLEQGYFSEILFEFLPFFRGFAVTTHAVLNKRRITWWHAAPPFPTFGYYCFRSKWQPCLQTSPDLRFVRFGFHVLKRLPFHRGTVDTRSADWMNPRQWMNTPSCLCLWFDRLLAQPLYQTWSVWSLKMANKTV